MSIVLGILLVLSIAVNVRLIRVALSQRRAMDFVEKKVTEMSQSLRLTR